MRGQSARQRLVSTSLACLLIVSASPAAYGQSLDPAEQNPFDRNVVGVELGGSVLGELWNLNDEREWLLDGTASFVWPFKDGIALVVRFHNIRVFQETENAFVQGFSPIVRWRMRERGSWRFYAEVGPGISWSDVTVPPRGTKFNYLFEGGGGIQRRLGSNSHLVLGATFLHISNNGREGRGRNPDIEAVGAQVAVGVTF
jgi:hypothetical protein